MTSMTSKSYGERAALHTNPAAIQLLRTMESKRSNLCVSVDVYKKASFLDIIDTVGPYVCLIKTHIDIIEDFDHNVIEQLQALSEKHNFLIFEDRKFADIGNTVVLQYSKGVYKIADWSHITNAHPVPGPSVITGLASVGLPLGRGLLLLAEMSTKGTLATAAYSLSAIDMAQQHRDFVIGFIAMSRSHMPSGQDDFLILTPGVGLDSKGDSMGQQYRSPSEVIHDNGCDIIIVGRGIYGNDDILNIQSVKAQAERYREEGWKAYERRLQDQCVS